MVNCTEIVKLIVEIIFAIASAFLIPWLKTKWDSDKISKLMKLVDIGVLAAEQIFTKEQWSEKKEYVQDYLANLGYKVDTTAIDTAIESAVKRIKSELKDGDQIEGSNK